MFSKKIYLNIPFTKKEFAKKLGANFDWKIKKWYSYNDNINLNKLLTNFNQNNNKKTYNNNNLTSINLIGENRNYGGNKLYIDLIPKFCWFTNVRYCIQSNDWNRIRKHVYERVNYKCECCGIYTKNIEAHERWHYYKSTKTQKLMRIIALCKMCHMATHIGLTNLCGKYKKAINHLKSVRNFTNKEVLEHEKNSYKILYERNKIEWDLDISLITNNGIKLKNHLIEKNNKINRK